MYDHVDLRVADIQAARPFYDALLSALGFTRINADEESAGYHRPNVDEPQPFLWLVQDPLHRPNGTRIAFAAADRSTVDRLAAVAQSTGARRFEAPALIAEYGPSYYAAFFEDAEGNKFEVCCRA